MTTVVNVHEAKTHLSRLLERVKAGEEIILSKAGKPCAKLVPLSDEKPPRQPGMLKDWVIPDAFYEPLPDEDLRLWTDGTPSDPLGEGRGK